MKRIGYLYDKVTSKENINAAIHNASKGKKTKRAVKKVLKNIDYCANEIYNTLKNKSYKPNLYHESKINDGITKKHRIIYKPKFYPDQIIHWCLMQIIQPILMKKMYHFTCASIPKRGILYAKKACEKWIRRDIKNTKYCLKLDVKKFYPSINKDILKNKFKKIIKDKDILNLIDTIIDSHNTGTGLPIGNYTSQWFANFYLQDLDYYIKQQLNVKYYIRYMDDMILFGSNKKKLHKIRIKIEDFLAKEKLSLKPNWQVFNISKRPLDFVGYVFARKATYIRKTISIRMIRKSRKVKQNLNYRNASAIFSYLGWMKHSNSYCLYSKYFKKLDIKKLKGVIRSEDRKVSV